MSETENASKPRYEKGQRLAITAGRKGIGVRGEIFWVGENKYGPGWRYGLRGGDGQTYWVDESHLGPEEGAPPEPEAPPPRPELPKGTMVKIISGREGVGETGAIFWVGDSRYGNGKRYGVRGEGEDTFWVDEQHVEPVDAPAPSADDASARSVTEANEFSDAPPIDDGAPMPSPDAYTAGSFEADAPFPADDDAPFPADDDAPFPADDDAPFPADDDVPFPADDDVPF